MTIPVTLIKTFTRQSANASLPTDAGTVESTTYIRSYVNTKQAFINAGNLTQSSTTSGDGLTTTITLVCNNLTTYSNFETALDIGTRAEYSQYAVANGLTNTISQAGISQPFTCTNVFTFPTAGLEIHDDLSTTLSNNTNERLSNLIVTSTSITAVHTYNNSDDFNSTYWKNRSSDESLHAAGVTRTITYALV